MTIRNILVPLDSSPFGEHALPYALSLARRSGAELVLAHVVVPPSFLTSLDIPMPAQGEEGQATAAARRYLDGVAARVRLASSVVVRPALLEGVIADAVCDLAASAGADLIVLTTHGRGPLSRFWIGSVATDLIQRTPVPLLVVRPKDEPADLTQEPALKRILIPLDGSAFGEDIIPLAVAVGGLTGAEYRLLRVVPPVLIGGWDGAGGPAIGNLPAVEQFTAAASDYLSGLGVQFPELHGAQTHAAIGWPPAGAILSDAAANGVDMIALETRGRSGLARFFLGSVADKVVREATVPVLLRRPPAG